VVPRGFRLLNDRGADVILPLQLDRATAVLGTFSYHGIARLGAGVTPEQAGADFARLIPRVLATFPPIRGSTLELFQTARLTPLVRPLRDEVVGDIGQRLWLLMAGVALVLVIACANVANLLLVRADGRRAELALRAALGATQTRIVQHLLSETVILAGLAGALGAALAYAGLGALVDVLPASVPRLDEVRIATPAIVFNAVVAGVTSLAIGLAPVLRVRDERAAISSTGRGGTAPRERRRAQRSLGSVQVALALVLVACSALMLRTFRALTQVEPGFSRPEHVQAFRLALTPAAVAEDDRVPLLEQRIRDELAAIPGIDAVSFGTSIPLDGDVRYDNIYAADHPSQSAPPLRHVVFSAPGYFPTLGIRVLAGRDFTWADYVGDRPIAVVSASFAREYWGSAAAAIGKRIRPSSRGAWCEIVGVAGDVHDDGMDRLPRPTVYWPARAANLGGSPLRVQRYVTFVLRTPRAGTPSLLGAVRRAVAAVDGNIAVSDPRTLDDLYARSLSRTTLTLILLGIAGVVALVLGAIGIYGVVAHSVARRRNEIGVRLALGATPLAILRLVVGQGMHVVGVGLLAGLAASFLATRFMSSVIFGVRPNDPLTYIIVVPLLAAVGLAACTLPAIRAMRIAPATALRHR
jgi:predicted permease